MSKRNVYTRPPKMITINQLKKKIIIWEVSSMISMMLLIWADDIFHFSHLIFGTVRHDWIWQQTLLESTYLILFSISIIFFTSKLFKRIKYLTGFLPMCASCKKIRVNNSWITMDQYVTNHSEAQISHGMCPECTIKYYPDLKVAKDIIKKS